MEQGASKEGLTFELFCRSYKPFVRPKGLQESVARAFNLDAEFFAEFRYLKPFLSSSQVEWGDDILTQLTGFGALGESFDREAVRRLKTLYRKHSIVFRSGRFGEAYFDSIEEIALFFAFHDVKTLWLAGVYRNLTNSLIDTICERAMRRTKAPTRRTLRALSSALSLELNQIQRTFTMYERQVSESLVQDLSYSGILTKPAAGKTTGAATGLADGRDLKALIQRTSKAASRGGEGTSENGKDNVDRTAN